MAPDILLNLDKMRDFVQFFAAPKGLVPDKMLSILFIYAPYHLESNLGFVFCVQNEQESYCHDFL